MPGCCKLVQILDKIHLDATELDRLKIISILKGPFNNSWGLVILLTSLLFKLCSEVANQIINESKNNDLY